MKKKIENHESRGWKLEIELPTTSSTDLRTRQSVRATFRLTEKAIEALSIVSKHLGIKQKSLFDHLVEDPAILRQIAREIQDTRFEVRKRVQKTFVISRGTLTHLESVSKTFNAPRDALVEYSLQRLIPIIEKERVKHLERKKLLNRLETHLEEGEIMLREAGDRLGGDDPMLPRMIHAMEVYRDAYERIAFFVKKGGMIEDF
jgi:uncharacterized protein (UPF0147 family)